MWGWTLSRLFCAKGIVFVCAHGAKLVLSCLCPGYGAKHVLSCLCQGNVGLDFVMHFLCPGYGAKHVLPSL